MINEFEFHHGLILVKLIHKSSGPLVINNFTSTDNSAYVINNKIGIYVKYCKKRLTPWRFTFLKNHQDLIRDMRDSFDEVFVLLICNKDGVVILDWDSLKSILDSNHDDVEWVSVSRSKNKMYTVGGTDGELQYKVGKLDFPNKIIQRLG